MPAFAPTYSAAMREALFREAIDNAVSVREVLRRARAGELEDLSPADGAALGGMAYGYALQLVREERQDRGGISQARGQPVPIAREIATRLLKRALRDVERIERDKRKSPMNAREADDLLKVADRAAALIDRLDKMAGGDSTPDTASKRQPSKPRGLAAQLAAAQDTEQPDDNTIPSDHGHHRTPRTQTPDRQTDNTSDGAVLSRAVASAPLRSV
jgi:hypothetical protein